MSQKCIILTSFEIKRVVLEIAHVCCLAFVWCSAAQTYGQALIKFGLREYIYTLPDRYFNFLFVNIFFYG